MWQRSHSDKPKYCEDCRALQSSSKQYFDCTECEFNPPHLSDNVKQVLRLYTLSRSQRVYHSAGLAGFDYPAIRQVAEINCIHLGPMMFNALWILEGLELEVAHKDE